MKFLRKILLLTWVACNAAHSFSNIGSTECSGLFLLRTSDKQLSAKQCGVHDALTIQNLSVYGDFRHVVYQGRYSDKWQLRGENTLDIATVGIESRFKYITLGIDINNLPFIKSNLTIHHPDSLFSITTNIARGSFDLGRLHWFSENKDDLVSEISADWETHILYRSISAEFNPGIHHFGISGTYLQSSPKNPDKEYYIRDSIRVLLAHGEYSVMLGKGSLGLDYTFVDADVFLYGIFHQETSRKRFMYIPLEAQLHLLQAYWDYGALKTNLNFVYISGKIEANQDRFFETLAPNRALPTSVLKSLSFSFLQKIFRIDADIEAIGIWGGPSYQWHIGHRYSINPSIGIDGYFVQGTLDVDKQIETLLLLTYNKEHEIYQRELKSAGCIASLGLELRHEGSVTISLDYGLTQLIPVYTTYKEFLPDENPIQDPDGNTSPDAGDPNAPKSPNQKKSGDLSTKKGAAFRNGFATHLKLSVGF